MSTMHKILQATTAAGLLAVASTAMAYDAGAVANGGTITGTITYAGTAPEPEELPVKKDTKVCAVEPKYSKDLVVNKDNKGVQYAVASLVAIDKGKAFAEPKPVLDQHGCEYLPYVLVAPTGGKIEILNSDKILHNIHTYSEKNPPVNRAQPKFKKKITESFAKPEMVKLTCDVHGWMKGWIAVSEHPYVAVTDADGKYELSDVPAGDYELRIWQEELGETTKAVSVPAGGSVSVDHEYAAK